MVGQVGSNRILLAVNVIYTWNGPGESISGKDQRRQGGFAPYLQNSW